MLTSSDRLHGNALLQPCMSEKFIGNLCGISWEYPGNLLIWQGRAALKSADAIHDSAENAIYGVNASHYRGHHARMLHPLLLEPDGPGRGHRPDLWAT